MHPLTLRSLNVGNIGEDLPTADYILSALSRKLQQFRPAITFNDGHFVVVGSGPSLVSHLEDIKAERAKGRPICSVKGAHDWLMDNGVEPDIFISLEPRERPLRHISKDRCAYLIASRCAPSLFDQLEGARIFIWHAIASKAGTQPPKDPYAASWDELNPTEECNAWKGKGDGVGGGTTSGIRAITIGFMMGFRKFILYGFDSCLAKDKFTKRFSGENVGSSKVMDVIVAGRRFYCNGALAQQATEFQELYAGLPNITIEAKGDGLIAAIISERRKRGYPA